MLLVLLNGISLTTILTTATPTTEQRIMYQLPENLKNIALNKEICLKKNKKILTNEKRIYHPTSLMNIIL
ncbi:MAG: hypothetical protein K0S93_145 [Nitrososphaeraceae archaeon]|jgi:hypothetical protein|nr:hypothetical protein [Nitrososphaeraceae archaeon]